MRWLTADHFYIQHRMNFVPLVIFFAVIAAHAIYTNAAAHGWRSHPLWVENLAYNKGAILLNIIDQLKGQIAVLAVNTYLAHITLGHHVRLGIVLDIGNSYRVKLVKIEGFCCAPSRVMSLAVQQNSQTRNQNRYYY